MSQRASQAAPEWAMALIASSIVFPELALVQKMMTMTIHHIAGLDHSRSDLLWLCRS